MPTKPNLLERLLLYRLNKGPAPILDLFGAGSVRAVVLADDLGLFEELQMNPRSIQDLAAAVDAHPDGITALLRFLESQGYVEANGDQYTTTAMADRWATDAHGTNIVPWFRFWQDVVFPFWDDNLAEAIRRGQPDQTVYEWLDDHPVRWPIAQAGFRAAGTILIDEILQKIELPTDATELLDVGGGHGYYSMELVESTPGLNATIFDRPDALTVATEATAERALEERISVVEGDYTTDDLGTSDKYDVVLLFNVIHAHDESGTRDLFARAKSVLRPGGRLIILDQFRDKGRMPVSRAGIGFVSLTYLVTLGARVHEYADVVDWLRDAGFENIAERSIRRAGPGNSLVHATLLDET